VTLPPELQAFSRLPIWNVLFLLLALGIAAYSGWSLWRHRERADLYYLLLGVYLLAFQAPVVFPSIGQTLGVSCPLSGDFTSRFVSALPPIGLFVLAIRAR
jgi:hypothetical protein